MTKGDLDGSLHALGKSRFRTNAGAVRGHGRIATLITPSLRPPNSSYASRNNGAGLVREMERALAGDDLSWTECDFSAQDGSQVVLVWTARRLGGRASANPAPRTG